MRPYEQHMLTAGVHMVALLGDFPRSSTNRINMGSERLKQLKPTPWFLFTVLCSHRNALLHLGHCNFCLVGNFCHRRTHRCAR